jgi:hypothetical protein
MALSYQVDETVPLFHYSTRLCVPENKPNGQILPQEIDQIPSFFPAYSPPSNRYLCFNPIKQVHVALSCLVHEVGQL